MTSSIFVHIKNGEIQNKPLVATVFKGLSDGRYKLTLESFNPRSLSQNKYYWGILIPIAKEGLRAAGWDEIKTDEDAHEFLKDMFLKRIITNADTGEIKRLIKSTTELSTSEFAELIEQVIKWGAEFLSIQIPFPNEPMIASYDREVNATIIK